MTDAVRDVRSSGARARPTPRRGRRPGALAVAAALLAACAPEPAPGDGPPETAVLRAAIGEPVDGFPQWAERVSLVWANRARSDPAADLAGCTVCAEAACYGPVPPLVWHHQLGRAARFHSDNLALGGCGIQHASPCSLVADVASLYRPGPCDGSASCACEPGTFRCGSSGTDWDVRVRRFAGAARSENISSTSDAVMSHYMFLWERDTSSACGFRIANGHRFNILTSENRSVGIGVSGSGPLTQDFLGSGTPSGLVSGVHYPQSGATLQFRANWYGSDPTAAWVNLDGSCHDLALERGTRTNGTYLVELSGISGCRTYYFQFVEGGTEHYFPTTGSFGVGCAFDWQATREPPCGCTPTCAGLDCGDDGCGGSCGTCTGGKSCSSGVCVCPSGQRDCSGTCVDTSVDSSNCGRCGNVCRPPEVCVSGLCACAPACSARECGDDGCGGSCGTCGTGAVCDASGSCLCPAGLIECSGECVDTATDRRNCGSCGNACAVGQGCVAGSCTSSCVADCGGRDCGDDGCGGSCGSCAEHLGCGPAGLCACPGELVECGRACVDTATDRANCGGCGTECAEGATCEAGECVSCRPDCTGRECGDDRCGGSCGGCGLHRYCTGDGLCACWEELAECEGECVDLLVDVDDCGECSTSCSPFELCELGECVCRPLCEGRQCGSDGCGSSCGRCEAGHLCAAATCLCEGHLEDCGGECVDLRSAPAHCGACEVACPPAERCAAGECTTEPEGACEPGCEGRACGDDGCGGGCGTCQPGLVCADGGRCHCPGETLECEGLCVDTRSDDRHCGVCGAACVPGSRCVRGRCTGSGPAVEEIGLGPFWPGGPLPGLEGGPSCECSAGAGLRRPEAGAALLLALALLLARGRLRPRGGRGAEARGADVRRSRPLRR